MRGAPFVRRRARVRDHSPFVALVGDARGIRGPVEQLDEAAASLQKTPQEVLAVFVQPSYDLNPEVIKSSLCLALDDVQDPGNLGTIIRLADWFGIEHIFCSAGTADVYNPKTVQATMGADRKSVV